jgi:small multidrug resistance family-3 protein
MWTIPTYILAAFAEIGGCFAFWAWLRLDKTPLWLVPGMASLALFAWALARIDADCAGRSYAAYGGIYILAALIWMWAAEGSRPDRWDITGAAICIMGAMVIIFGPRRG